jgi:predicted sulfurtransferase
MLQLVTNLDGGVAYYLVKEEEKNHLEYWCGPVFMLVD